MPLPRRNNCVRPGGSVPPCVQRKMEQSPIGSWSRGTRPLSPNEGIAMKKASGSFALVWLIVATAASGFEPTVTEPPECVRKELELSPFYTKYVSAGGFPVVGSDRVSDYALKEAAYLINQMLRDRPDVRDALIKDKVRCAVMAPDELTTVIPEHSDLTPSKFWDRRARGLGPTRQRPAVSCGAENLLCYPGDPYHQENILIHEFAHAIHLMGLNSIDKTFDAKLKSLYKKAMEKGLWKDKYAANNHAEYWAEGVQSFFDTNRKPDHDHNHVDTREELIEYDPDLARLIAREFRDTPWRYRRPADRKEAGHLAGYDPKKAPRFEWPAELVQWYEKYQAQQKAEREKGEEEQAAGRK